MVIRNSHSPTCPAVNLTWPLCLRHSIFHLFLWMYEKLEDASQSTGTDAKLTMNIHREKSYSAHRLHNESKWIQRVRSDKSEWSGREKVSLVKCQNINEKMDSETEHHKIPITEKFSEFFPSRPSLAATFATLSIGDWKSFLFFLLNCRVALQLLDVFHASNFPSHHRSANGNNNGHDKYSEQERWKWKNYNYRGEICVANEIEARARAYELNFSSILFH